MLDLSVYLCDLKKEHIASGQHIHTNKGKLTIRLVNKGWQAQQDGITKGIEPVAGPLRSEKELIDEIVQWAWKR